MSDKETVSEATETPSAESQEVTEPAQDETDWKKEARKWETLAKQNKDAAERLTALEEANKSEAQKAAEELERLRSENSEFRTRAQIAEWTDAISKETGVPAHALKGSTEEELREHAETLKSLIEKQPSGLQPIPGEGKLSPIPLNGDGIEAALRSALGVN